MEEAEFLCDRIGIIVKGALRCLGSAKEVFHLILDFFACFYWTIMFPYDELLHCHEHVVFKIICIQVSNFQVFFNNAYP